MNRQQIEKDYNVVQGIIRSPGKFEGEAITKEKVEFVFAMARHSAVTMWDLQRLMRYGATHKRLMEQDCNVGLTPDERLKMLRIRKSIDTLVLSFGCAARYSADPRGATVKIAVPDGYTNDWGKIGICVPTS